MGLNVNFGAYGLSGEKAVIVAVSGGSDSLALLFLLHDYIATLSQAPKLIAITVDHGLRPESADEALYVASLCQAHEIEHHILQWSGDKPLTGVPAAAREKRYDLLIKAANKAHARMIFTGHTQDDQIETFLMRKSRGTAGRGLAVMAELTLLQSKFMLVRALLTTQRKDLRAYLAKKKICWVDDPTNVDLHYERPRMRKYLASNIDAAHKVTILSEIAQAQKERLRVNIEVAAYLNSHEDAIHVRQDGAIDLCAQALSALKHDAASLLFGVVATLVSGKTRLPAPADIERIYQHLALDEFQHKTINLHGAIIERRQKFYRFWRENRHLPELIVRGGEEAIWDGRYLIKNSSLEEVFIKSISVTQLQKYMTEQNIQLEAKRNKQKECLYFPSLATQPVIFCKDKIIWSAATGSIATDSVVPDMKISIKNVFSLFDHVLPGHDFILEQAVKAATCAKTSPKRHFF